MDMEGCLPDAAEADEFPSIAQVPARKRAAEMGLREDSAAPVHLEIVAPSSSEKLPKNEDESLAAGREYRRAAEHRRETERAWAGDVASASHEAFAVIRALKAENAALAYYNRVLLKSRPPVSHETRRSPSNDDPLTPREHEVLNLIAYGKTTKETAFVLGITFKTAASHRYRIMDKLGVHTSAELIRVAVKSGFVDPEQ